MRAKLKLVSLLFWVLAYVTSAKELQVLITAATRPEIVEWAKAHAFAARFFDYEEKDKKCIVMLCDTGSGVYRDRIYLYLFENNEWNLVLIRNTNTRVNIEKTKTSLVFKSKSGLVLLEQPFASLQFNFNPSEQ